MNTTSFSTLILKALKYSLLFVPHFLFFSLTRFVRKEKNLWLFGAWHGEKYSDNSKYLFEWILQRHPEIHAVWITKNKTVFQELKEKEIPVVYARSFAGFKLLAKAAVIVETHGNIDIGGFRPYGAIVVQLYHGIGPKELKWRRTYTGLKGFMYDIICDCNRESFWMVRSEEDKLTEQSRHGLDDKHVFITGYPRTDILLRDNSKHPVNAFLEEKFPHHKKILYMPTLRRFGESKDPTALVASLRAVNELLRKNNLVLLFKPHFGDMKKYAARHFDFSNIVLATDDAYVDVYGYISCFDALICDYSSLMYDFLLVDKPIVLYTYDLEEYRSAEGLLPSYFSHPCGPMCSSWEDTIRSVISLTEEDSWAAKRLDCKKYFQAYTDGKNTERVFLAIERLTSSSF